VTELPSSLDRYRHQLERAVAADLRRRLRRMRLRAGAVVAVLALLVVVLNVLPGGDGRRGLPPAVEPASAVERAAAALRTEGGTILHIHLVGRQFEDGRPDIRWENEAWLGPDGYRAVETSPEGRVAESEQTGRLQRLWDADAGRVVETRADSAFEATDKFREEAIAYLRSGNAKVSGQIRVGGRDAIRIESEVKGQTFIVDARTYTPIEFRTRGTGGGTVLRFPTYERIPLTEDSEQLLSISAQHGGAPVVRDDAAYQAAQARLFPNG
jgi:hypothetical protein